MLKHKFHLIIGISIALFTIACDQLSKVAILNLIMNPPRHIPITAFFDLILTWNKGVSFSFFSSYGDTGTLILIIVSFLITFGLLFWLTQVSNLYLSCGLGLIIGGAVGNLIDRLHYKAVIDFLYFHLGTFSWPAFNIADTAITIGVALILIESFVTKKGDRRV